MNDPETRARELRALGGAMKELGLKESTIITADHEETLHDAGRTVHATPYWKWAMGR
jgi:predicted AAA+ superfamily ATPase